jgi:hypothetical protein
MTRCSVPNIRWANNLDEIGDHSEGHASERNLLLRFTFDLIRSSHRSTIPRLPTWSAVNEGGQGCKFDCNCDHRSRGLHERGNWRQRRRAGQSEGGTCRSPAGLHSCTLKSATNFSVICAARKNHERGLNCRQHTFSAMGSDGAKAAAVANRQARTATRSIQVSRMRRRISKTPASQKKNESWFVTFVTVAQLRSSSAAYGTDYIL